MEIVQKELEQRFLSLGIPLADFGVTDKSGIIFKSRFRNPEVFKDHSYQNNILLYPQHIALRFLLLVINLSY